MNSSRKTKQEFNHKNTLRRLQALCLWLQQLHFVQTDDPRSAIKALQNTGLIDPPATNLRTGTSGKWLVHHTQLSRTQDPISTVANDDLVILAHSLPRIDTMHFVQNSSLKYNLTCCTHHNKLEMVSQPNTLPGEKTMHNLKKAAQAIFPHVTSARPLKDARGLKFSSIVGSRFRKATRQSAVHLLKATD